MYYIYCDYLEREGFEIITISEDPNGIRTDLLEEKLQKLGKRLEQLSFFYIVTINNPTCSILSNDRRREIIRIVSRVSEKLGRKVPLIFDKAYEDLIHDPAVIPPESGLIHDSHDLVYEVGTISKILSPCPADRLYDRPGQPFYTGHGSKNQ